MWGYHQFEGEPTHEYLFDKPSETSGPYLSDWSAYQPTMDNAYIDFTTSMPSFSVFVQTGRRFFRPLNLLFQGQFFLFALTSLDSTPPRTTVPTGE